MKKISDYLDEAKVITGSDYKTAQLLGVTRQRVSSMRHDQNISNENAARIAKIIGVDPLEIIAAGEVCKNPAKAEFWGKWVAATVIMSVAASSYFSSESVAYDNFQFASLYIMRICG